MICKFCGEQMEDNHKFCPFCGKDPAHSVASAQVAEIETAQEAATDVVVEKPKKKVWKLVAGIAAAIVALGALSVVLLLAMGVELLPRPNDIFCKDSFTVSDEKAVKNGNKVVATIGDKVLTNAQLQLYYRAQVIELLNYYGSYISSIGLDYTKPLSEQMHPEETEKTWEQYMLEIAIETWQNYQTVAILAENAGFVMGSEWQESLDAMPADLAEQAASDGYDSAEALLKDVIGPACSEQIYLDYVYLAYLSNAYYLSVEESLVPSMEDIEAYFAEHEEAFAQSYVTKDSGMVADVRHILIMPKGGTVDETTGATTYSEAEWAECLAKAEEVLNEWKSGEATEATFAELANKYSEDGGSNTNGGLYEGISPSTNFVEEFLMWTINMTRKPGDYEIIKTQFGYHIMYWSAGEAEWIEAATTQLLAERLTEMTDTAKEQYPITIDYRKIALSELEL